MKSSLGPNERLTKKYLTTYFTNYAEQNWIQAAKSRKGNNENPAQQGGGGEPEDGVITDHDTQWDYKVVNGKWFTKNKNSGGNWIDISNNAEATNKLNNKYPDAGGSGMNPQETKVLEAVASASGLTVAELQEGKLKKGELSTKKLKALSESLGLTVKEIQDLIEKSGTNENQGDNTKVTHWTPEK